MARTTRSVLFTVGYEGKSVSQLVNTLKANGVERLIDVRMTPLSRKAGFSLTSLFQRLRREGITYEHIGELGNPPAIRRFFHEGRLEEGRRRYRAVITNGKAGYVDLLIALSAAQPTAIMCVEADVEACHRLVIAEVAGERAPTLELKHI